MEWSQARNNQIEYCCEGISSLSPAVGAYASVRRSYYNPANTLRNNNVVITSKRRHFDVTTSKWRRFDVTTTLLLRHVFRGNFPYETPSFLVYHDNPWRSEPFWENIRECFLFLSPLCCDGTYTFNPSAWGTSLFYIVNAVAGEDLVAKRTRASPAIFLTA